MADNDEDERLLREASAIKLGRSLPEKGRESVTTGQPRFSLYSSCLFGPMITDAISGHLTGK
jgi:hypothetical protein